jgi:hypothetical protein
VDGGANDRVAMARTKLLRVAVRRFSDPFATKRDTNPRVLKVTFAIAVADLRTIEPRLPGRSMNVARKPFTADGRVRRRCTRALCRAL